MALIFQPGPVQLGLYFLIGELGSGVSSFHYIMPSLAECLVMDVVARAHCGPAVAGSRLNEHSPERSVQQNLAIHNGVVRHAPGQAQVCKSRLIMEVIQNMEGDFLEPGLKAGGDILLAFAYRRSCLP